MTSERDAANVINSRATETDARALEHEFDEFVFDWPAEPPEPAAPGAPVAPARPKFTVEERFGQAVMRLRLHQGWSQRDLQRTCGVHQSQISRLESGRQRGLSSRRIFAILRALHVGEIAFLPPPTVPQTQLEIMLFGDPWERAGRAAERRVNRRRSA